MSDGTYTRVVVADVDGLTIIPLAPEAEPAYVDGEGGTTLFAHGPEIPADEFERFFGIYSSGGTDALAAELQSRGFKGCSERDGRLVAWRTPEQDESEGRVLARGGDVEVGCLWLGLDYPEGAPVRLGICIEEGVALSKEGVLSLEDAESLKRVLASFFTHYRENEAGADGGGA